MSDADLPPLVVALTEPERYPHPVDSVEVLQTHISWILLAGDYAYKIKKPVDLGFLDFSTLEKRRFFCREELRLNRRLAPEIYLDVLAVAGSPEEPRWDGGEAIEYAVKMRRFPQSAQLDRVLERGELRARQLDAFARTIADFHDHAAVAGRDVPHGRPKQIFAPAAANFAALRDSLRAKAERRQLDELEDWTHGRYTQLAPVFEARRRAGRIREGHGDLHLRNLAWFRERPLVFDCIEFDPELRWIDVINDVAFLIMDLQARDQAALASRFLNRYLEQSGDYAGTAVLRFYLVYRALVRAKVDAIRAAQLAADSADARVAAATCRHYLELGATYTRPARPRLIITRGLSASGKSTLALAVAEQLGAIRIRSDVERKRLFGLRPEQDAGADPEAGIYTAAAGRETYAKLVELAARVLDADFPVVIDAACLKAGQRRPFRELARRRQLPYTILDCEAAPSVLRERIRRRPKEASDADLAVLEHQLETRQPLLPEEEPLAIRIETDRPVDTPALLARLGGNGSP